MKKEKNVIRGKKSKAAGTRFELKVRKDLENKGWVISKWNNTVDLEKDKLVPAKRKYNPFSKVMAIGTGFPDFIVFRPRAPEIQKIIGKNMKVCGSDEIIGIESKTNGYLDKEEKKKAKWLLNNYIFSKIIIASRGEKRGTIIYKEFKENGKKK